MLRWLGSFILAVLVALSSSAAAGPGPQVSKLDEKVSINADGITLARLLELWDKATGMKSRVSPELANRTVSVRFSGLTVNDAVRTMFQNLPFDYVFIESKGITVTGPAQTVTASRPTPVNPVVEDAMESTNQLAGEQREKPSPAEVLLPEPRPPRVMYTPFGTILDPRMPVVQLPPIAGEVPPPPFFTPMPLPPPPAGAPNGPVQNNLFAPISIRTR